MGSKGNRTRDQSFDQTTNENPTVEIYLDLRWNFEIRPPYTEAPKEREEKKSGKGFSPPEKETEKRERGGKVIIYQKRGDRGMH